MNKNLIYALLFIGLLGAQLSNAVPPKILSEQYVIEIKNAVAQHLRFADQYYQMLSQLIATAPTEGRGFDAAQLRRSLFEKARNMKKIYDKSLENVLTEKMQIAQRGYLNDSRIAQLWQQLNYSQKQIQDLLRNITLGR